MKGSISTTITEEQLRNLLEIEKYQNEAIRDLVDASKNHSAAIQLLAQSMIRKRPAILEKILNIFKMLKKRITPHDRD